MTMALGFFIVGVFTMLAGDRAIYYYRRWKYFSGSSMFPCGWKPPVLCVLKDHRWEKTDFVLPLISGTLMTVLEVCERCEMGRLLTLQGPRYETPEGVRRILQRTEGVAAGKVVTMKKLKPSKSSPDPLPPAS